MLTEHPTSITCGPEGIGVDVGRGTGVAVARGIAVGAGRGAAVGTAVGIGGTAVGEAVLERGGVGSGFG